MATENDDLRARLNRLDNLLSKNNEEDEISEHENEDETTNTVDYRDDTDESARKSSHNVLSDEDGVQHDLEDYEGKVVHDKQDKVPAYLLDTPPSSKVDAIKWYLLHGKTEEELVAEGFNMGTVRNSAHELRKDGLYQRPPKEDRPLAVVDKVKKKTTDVTLRADKELRSYAKGSPAEDLIQHFARLPDEMRDNVQGEVFESGMKFGLSVAVLGIRMAQELSNLGVSQVKPLIDMTKSMREGEALAAKTAAIEAANEAAGQIGEIIGPTLQDVRSSLASQAEARLAGTDPMRSMIADTFKPMLQNMIKQLMPMGLPGTDSDSGVSGWTKRKG